MGGDLAAAASFRKVPSGRPVYLIASAVVSHGPGPACFRQEFSHLC